MIDNNIRRLVSLITAATVATGFALPSLATEPATTTPIKHVIVIFQENVSFDHYFGTYPVAANSTAALSCCTTGSEFGKKSPAK